MDISSRIHSLEQEIAELTAVLTVLMITYRQTSHRRGLHLKWELITLAGNEWMYGCYEQFLYHCHLFVVPMLWGVNVCFISAMERRNTEANMTEWSKVLRSGRSVFARVGSNPTVCIFLFSPFIVICFILFAMCEISMHEECNGMCFAHNSYWFILCDNEMQGVLVLICQINWRSKEGSDYVSWLICRLIVVINQRAEVMFLLFILSSNVVLLTRFDLCL